MVSSPVLAATPALESLHCCLVIEIDTFYTTFYLGKLFCTEDEKAPASILAIFPTSVVYYSPECRSAVVRCLPVSVPGLACPSYLLSKKKWF